MVAEWGKVAAEWGKVDDKPKEVLFHHSDVQLHARSSFLLFYSSRKLSTGGCMAFSRNFKCAHVMRTKGFFLES